MRKLNEVYSLHGKSYILKLPKDSTLAASFYAKKGCLNDHMNGLKVHLLHSVGTINCAIGILLKEYYCYLNKYRNLIIYTIRPQKAFHCSQMISHSSTRSKSVNLQEFL